MTVNADRKETTTNHTNVLDLFLYAAYNRKQVVPSVGAFGLGTAARRKVEDECSEDVKTDAFQKYLERSSQECSVNVSRKYDPTSIWFTKDFSKFVELTREIYEASDRFEKRAARNAADRDSPIAETTTSVKIGELVKMLESLGHTVTFTLTPLRPSEEVSKIWKENEAKAVTSKVDLKRNLSVNAHDKSVTAAGSTVQDSAAKTLEDRIRDL